MKDTPKFNCTDCLYWQQLAKDREGILHGECRRYAPRKSASSYAGLADSTVVTPEFYWCGDYRNEDDGSTIEPESV